MSDKNTKKTNYIRNNMKVYQSTSMSTYMIVKDLFILLPYQIVI